MQSHNPLRQHIEKLSREIQDAGLALGPLRVANDVDEHLMKGKPTAIERANSTAALADGLSVALKTFIHSGVQLPNEDDGDKLAELTGHVISGH